MSDPGPEWEPVDPVTRDGITFDVWVQRGTSPGGTTPGPIVARLERARPTAAQIEESTVRQALNARIADLQAIVAYPSLPTVPAGTFTTAQLSDYLRVLRNEAQTNRAGAQKVAGMVLDLYRLVRGDFGPIG